MTSWFQRLKSGLSKSSSKLTTGVTALLTKKKLDAESLQALEDLLIQGDLGVKTATKLVQSLAETRFPKDVESHTLRHWLAQEIAGLLEPVSQPLIPDNTLKPHVVLAVGVNGSGKTTTLGKLANLWTAQGKKVTLVAGDTFRAAATEQLKIWANRAGVPLIAGAPGCEASGLVYGAFETARREKRDILLIDTAGRLHTKTNLMAELSKISRVLKKIDPQAPHTTLLILDATTGQNAHAQVEHFKAAVDVSGLVLTKLDGTAKGGVLVNLAQSFSLPIHAIGVGESLEDLHSFNARDYACSLLGLDTLNTLDTSDTSDTSDGL